MRKNTADEEEKNAEKENHFEKLLPKYISYGLRNSFQNIFDPIEI